jgi:deoxyribodipyrimidine photo-lyase
VLHEIEHAAAHDHRLAEGAAKFRTELLWREFCYGLLAIQPRLNTVNFRSDFNDFPWKKDEKNFRAWTRGETGYPLVDAGMRQLWQTGFMHNRVRMVVASFLVKHLLIDWRRGEQWFWDCLVDADPANNPASWQWVAGCGADAAPYFRIFNPTSQAEKFDPDGGYRAQFVPGFTLAPAKGRERMQHDLFDKTESPRANAAYPAPIVDHDMARKRALAAFQDMRSHKEEPDHDDSD